MKATTTQLMRALASLLACSAAAAEPLFPTIEDAARAALAEAMPLSSRYEFGGVIYSLDGRYGYTAPQTSEEPTSLKIRVRLPRGADVAATYHTHPDTSDAGHLFSMQDIEAAKAVGIPCFIGVLRDGSIRVFDPARDRAGVRISKQAKRISAAFGRVISVQSVPGSLLRAKGADDAIKDDVAYNGR